MNATHNLTWIGPETLTKNIEGNTMTLTLDFKDGRGGQPITIEKGDGFYMWQDHAMNIRRKFIDAEGLRWEFELDHQIAADLHDMEAGDPDQTTRMNWNAAKEYHEAQMAFMNSFGMGAKKPGTNMTPKKKKRKK